MMATVWPAPARTRASGRTDPAAADDDDVHAWSVLQSSHGILIGTSATAARPAGYGTGRHVLDAQAGLHRAPDRVARRAPPTSDQADRPRRLRLGRHLVDRLRNRGDPARAGRQRRHARPSTTSSRSRSSSSCCWPSSSPATARRSTPTRAAAAPTSCRGRTSARRRRSWRGRRCSSTTCSPWPCRVSAGVAAITSAFADAAPVPRRDVPVLHRAHDRRQPPRREGVGPDLRRPHLHLRRRAARADRRRPVQGLRRQPRADPRTRRRRSPSSPTTAPPSPASRCSS